MYHTKLCNFLHENLYAEFHNGKNNHLAELFISNLLLQFPRHIYKTRKTHQNLYYDDKELNVFQ